MDKKNTAPCPVEGNGEIENGVSSSQNPVTLEHPVLLSTSQTVQNTMGIRKNYKRTANRGKKGSQGPIGKTYALKPSDSSVRVLRSASSSKATPTEHVQTPVQPAAKRRKRGRPSNKSSTDEFSQIRKRVRYILNRMNYEQSLIEAYASEGWKNQSLDKIRPEKELERAKAEILRCKLRIREVFQNLDSLLSKGKIDESLFDSEGEIDCEDIFCATCGSRDVTLGNDIILCDGACDRGFHQNCLNPPLRTEEIPKGDEGWLCPACDCKIDCIDVINELQGSDLSIDDSWEKVFPEAAVMANGSKQDDIFDLPSDDSDDNDFDPNMPEEHVASKEEGSSDEDEDEDEDGSSDSDDSNFLTSSDDSEPLTDKKKVDDLGLPSEDSEDDDYDPAGPDSDKEDVQEKKTSSDESDFTSDSDDFCEEIAKSGGRDEVSSPPVPGSKVGDVERSTSQANAANSDEDPMETEMDQSVILPVPGRRQVERLDYKKLYDEAYGGGASDSSDDEEWSGKSTPRKGNEESDSPAGKGSRSTRNLRRCDEHTPQIAQKSLDPNALHGSVDEKHGSLTSNGSNSTNRKGHYGPVINQKLHEHFKTEQYPSRSVKERLAEELGLTFRQVSRWFESRRHFSKVASKKGSCPDNHRPENNNSPVAAGTQLNEPEEAVMEKPNVRRNKDASISREAGSPKVASRKNRRKNATGGDVRGSKVDSAEDQIPGLDLADKARQKAIQQELKKKKMGR